MSFLSFTAVNPASSHRARFLLSTALVTLGLTLCGATQLSADEFILNNGSNQNWIDQDDGTWSNTSLIWTRDEGADTDEHNSARESLGGGQGSGDIGVLPESDNNSKVKLTVEGPLILGGLKINRDGYTLEGRAGTNAKMTGWDDGDGVNLRFTTAGGVRLDIRNIAFDGNVIIDGLGLVVYRGDATSDMTGLEVEERTNFISLGSTYGAATIKGRATLATHSGSVTNEGRLRLDDGASVTGQLVNTGTSARTVIDGDVTAGSVQNSAGGTIELLQAEDNLITTGPLQNSANISLHGTITGDVQNSAVDGSIGRIALDGGTIDGDLANLNGGVRLLGHGNVTGAVVNRGGIRVQGVPQDATMTLGSLDNQYLGTVIVDPDKILEIQGAVINSGHMTVNGTLALGSGSLSLLEETSRLTAGADAVIKGNVTNTQGILNSAANIEGSVTNSSNGSAKETNRIGGLIAGGVINSGALSLRDDLNTASFENSGTLTVRGGHVLTIPHLTDPALRGTLTNSGTVNLGSRINANVTNTGTDSELSGTGRVQGTVTNAGRLHVTGGTRGAQMRVGALLNTGVVDVDRNRVLNSDGSTQNNATINLSGTLSAGSQAVMNGDLVTGADGTINMQGGSVSGSLNNSTALSSVAGVGSITSALTNAGSVHVTGATGTTIKVLKVGSISNLANANIAVDEQYTLTVEEELVNHGTITADGVVDVDPDARDGALQNRNTVLVNQTGELKGLLSNLAGTLTSTGTIDGLDNRNTAIANLQGEVKGIVNNASTMNVTGVLDAENRINNANGGTLNITASGSELNLTRRLLNKGVVNLATKITGTVRNGEPSVSPGEFNLNDGEVDGDFYNDTTASSLNGTGTITGELSNHGKVNIGDRGTNTGDTLNVGKLTNLNNGVVNVAQDYNLNLENGGTNNSVMNVNGNVDVESGTLLSTSDLNIASTGSIAGTVRNKGEMDVDGTVTGKIVNENNGNLTLNNTVTGTVQNIKGGTVDATGTVTSAVSNAGELNLTGDLSVGSLLNKDEGKATIGAGQTLTTTNGKVVNTAGTADSDAAGLEVAGTVDTNIQNSGRLDLGSSSATAPATITGNVNNEGTTSLTGYSSVGGNFTNHGDVVAGSNADTLLDVTGVFYNASDGSIIGNDGPNGEIVIKAGDRILQYGNVEGNVRFEGIVVNGGNILMNTDRVLDEQVINAEGGVVTVTADVNAAGFDTENDGLFKIQKNGKFHNVGTFTNDGELVIDAGSELAATQLTNERAAGGTRPIVTNRGTITGRVINSGLLNSSGTINGRFENTGNGKANIAGTVTHTVDNNGRLTITGDLSTLGLVTQRKGDTTVNKNATVTGARPTRNLGDMRIAGTIDTDLRTGAKSKTVMQGGTVTQNVSNVGELNGTGTIEGQLENLKSGHLRLIAGDALSVEGGVTNRAKIIIGAGSQLDSTVQNTGTGLIELGGGGTITQDVINRGKLRGNGHIGGNLSNLGTGTTQLRGNVDGTVTQQSKGLLQTYMDQDLKVGTLINKTKTRINKGSTLTAENGSLNRGRLEVAGKLVGTLDTRRGGHVAMTGGTLEGAVLNSGRVAGTGDVSGDVRNFKDGRFQLNGAITGNLVNSGTVGVLQGQSLKVDGVTQNYATVNVGGTINADIDNKKAGTTNVLNGGRVAGTIRNDGIVNSAGTITGDLVNRKNANAFVRGQIIGRLWNYGTATTTGDLHVGGLTNRATAIISEGDVLYSDTLIDNTADLRVDGQISYDTPPNRLGQKPLAAAAALGAPAEITIRNHDGATLLVSGNVDANINNFGTTRVNESGTVTGYVWNRNGALFRTLGQIDGNIYNREGGTSRIGGTVTGDIGNWGNLRSIGQSQLENLVNYGSGVVGVAADTTMTVNNEDGLGNAGRVNVAGALNANVANTEDGRLRLMGGTITGSILNSGQVLGNGQIIGDMLSDGQVSVGLGDTLAISKTLTNQRGSVDVVGTLRGDVRNTAQGRTDVTGTLNGNVTNGVGVLNVDGGRVVGNVNNQAGSITTLTDGVVTGNFVNAADAELQAAGSEVTGTLTNNGLVSLDNGTIGDVFTVGGLAGAGTYALDLDLINMRNDMIRVVGGAATGDYFFRFDLAGDAPLTNVGTALTILDVDQSFGSGNNYTFVAEALPAISERIVYSVERNINTNDLVVVSQINPAIGAILGNVTLSHSLIGSVINRPTSPYVVGRAYEDEKNCGVGSWGRGMGGHAKATGGTNNGVSRVESTISADYYGMQVGTDLACFNGHFDGWNMTFGALLGVNKGDTSQPIYGIDPGDSSQTSARLASITTTDFDQIYGGLYVTATKDRWSFDVQYRREQTDFDITNTAIIGEGLGLADSTLTSKGQTLSGAISYSLPVGESGWMVVPTAGFAWSKFQIDDMRFEDGYRMSFGDVESKVGFVGSTITKTYVQEAQNSAVNIFATGTFYKDFAGKTRSVFSSDNEPDFDPQVLLNDHLGSYTELSLGANYVKVLSRGGKPMQLSTGTRLDARFGDNIDSVGITGQFRLQF